MSSEPSHRHRSHGHPQDAGEVLTGSVTCGVASIEKGHVMTRPGLRAATSMTLGVVLVALSLSACACASEIVEVSGSTGLVTGQEGDTTIFDDLSSSDDRLVGTSELTIECDRSEDGGTTIAECAGPITLTNDGGTWEGTCEGTSTWTTSEPAHVHVFDCTYLGTGDYQGLRFVQHLEGIDYPWPYTGRIEPVD